MTEKCCQAAWALPLAFWFWDSCVDSSAPASNPWVQVVVTEACCCCASSYGRQPCHVHTVPPYWKVLLENSVFVTAGRWGSRVYSARCLRRGSPYLTQPAEASTFVFELSFEGVWAKLKGDGSLEFPSIHASVWQLPWVQSCKQWCNEAPTSAQLLWSSSNTRWNSIITCLRHVFMQRSSLPHHMMEFPSLHHHMSTSWTIGC